MSDRYRMIIGGMIVIGTLALATAIALGNVQEKSSFGLGVLLVGVVKMAENFTGWAFRTKREDEKQ
jgi:hypothetical protein